MVSQFLCWSALAQPAWVPAVALLTALVVDRCLGEPTVRWHPVVWMGRGLERFAPFVLPRGSNGNGHGVRGGSNGGSNGGTGAAALERKAFWRGAWVWMGLAVLCTGLAFAVQYLLLKAATTSHAASGLPWSSWVSTAVAAVGLGIALKPLLAWRMLCNEVLAVEAALGRSLDEGRQKLSRLASRDVTQLSAEVVRESAIESLAENLNDSVIAPLFWFVLFGLPGAALYRFANTADAMWGYIGVRNGRDWTWAGKWAARADDVLSWIPARLTALLLSLVAGGLSLRILRREAARTPSPNSGWPMAAMALALGVRLRKPGVYTLNGAGRGPVAWDTTTAVRLADRVVLGFMVVALGLLYALSK